MQKRYSTHVSSSVFSYFIIKYSHFKRVFRKSENAIRWAINLALLSYQSIVCRLMSMTEIRFKADATTCVLMSTFKL